MESQGELSHGEESHGEESHGEESQVEDCEESSLEGSLDQVTASRYLSTFIQSFTLLIIMLSYLFVAAGSKWPTLSEVNKGGAEVEVPVDVYKAGKEEEDRGEEDREGEEEGEDKGEGRGEQELQIHKLLMTGMIRLTCYHAHNNNLLSTVHYTQPNITAYWFYCFVSVLTGCRLLRW